MQSRTKHSPVTPNRYPISEVRVKSVSWLAIATSTPLKIIFGNQENIVCTLIEEREESNDEETEHEDPSQNRLEEAADIVMFIFRATKKIILQLFVRGVFSILTTLSN